MYQVSQAFKDKIKEPIQEHRLTGTIGDQSFSEDNIVEGSFTINNQSTDTSDVVLGSCYVGQLTAEFTGINIAYGNWINKTITPAFALNLGDNTWESVPLGIYKIKEAKHTDHGVQVTAYDNMIKFDKKFRKSHYMNLAGMWNIISQICTDAGVTLGMTQAQIEALPNGDRTGINIYGSTGKKAEFANDITTLRDLLFWVAQTLGCFATINRAGQLEFRQYTQNVVDVIASTDRIEGATFADYITHYVGIYVENLDDNTEDYYGHDVTALQQELAETQAEITEDNGQITDLQADLVEWKQKLDNQECTQEEYDEAVAEINAQIKQLTKRAEWLSNAIAQSGDDGSDMVLGANPLVMAKNLTTRDQQRREILTALDNISYTPFNASVICGAHYDLGDVIQWAGGLYNSETDSFGCVMSWTYTHNGGTELEGFGVDPAVQLVRTKTQKSTDRANTNAITALKENDLVFDIDTDNNNAVVATNKKAYTQSLTTRVIYIWAYNVAWPPAAAIYKVTITSDSGNFAIVDTTATSGQFPCDVNGIIRYDSPAWLVWELPEGSPEPNITVRSERVWDNGYHPEYTLGDWWANGYNHCVYTENGVSWYSNNGFGGSIQHGIAYEYGEMPDENFESETAMRSAVLSGKVHPAGVSPYDQNMLATESTAKQAAANAEYFAEKLAGNDPTRKSETYSGNVNVMSEKTMQRLSDAFYQMGEAADNIGAVSDVKVDDVSVLTDKIANINTMRGATAQADGAKGLVPTPTAADSGKFLKGDGTWGEVQGGGGSAEMLAPTPFIYSEDEQQVGIWTDGKPLYAKTKSFTNVSKSGSLSFGVADAETVFIKDIGKASDSIPIPYVHGSAPSNNIGGFLTKTSSDVIWEFRSGNDAPSTLSGFMTLLYTKTTDTPWQGGFKAYGFSPVIYSDTEREIGVYTDGKPLYQKTYSGLSVSLGADWVNAIDISSLNVDKCIDGIGVASSGYQTPLCTKINGNYLQIYMNGMAGITISALTIKYTKSTDVAGSGKYTTLGTPAVHYDGEERVIGTWFGEMLYEKSWEFDSYILISANAITSLVSKGVTLSNVDFIVDNKLISAVDKRVYNGYSVGYFSGNIGVYNPTSADMAIDKVVLQYTKTS